MSTIDIPTRQRWMRALALSPRTALESGLAPHLPPPGACRWLRRPQTGLVMVEARSGGSGARFNLGELSVTRASVAVGERVGHAWIGGGDARHAELAALADALLQDDARHAELMAGVIAPLEDAIAARRASASRAAAASRVEFFTMVRGE
ncbi:phosphonate C-P lyase system protein PhnG [Crenobacter luteus]|uniref:Phosphonate C-P lyase system protein PhnG n=1 Tax=Crenobacter luteus TaxID=1452487 RepID=A0A165F6C7_9NEIS|nr:phosphonate C-P lyase system protein PhnG [Crenobacter luteus]KZE31684.1 phosphonate C-P lyase system protein PhnG [Crenobacter luteus]